MTAQAPSAADNAFQADVPVGESAAELSTRALAEMDAVAEALREVGVRVHVFEDHDHTRPDSVFPNNWVSTHAGGVVGVFPMYASNRRHERRGDVLEMLKSQYRVQTIIDYSGLEPDGIFLEGTGAMVLDHLSRVAYVARSHRADSHVLERFCTDFTYEPMVFDAVDSGGVPVYHTNVMGCVGTDVALMALEMIPDERRREQVRERLTINGRTLVEITEHQVREFAGNAVELAGRHADGSARRVMAMRQPGPLAGRGDRALLRDPGRRHPHHRARRRLGALHDRRDPPRPASRHRGHPDRRRRGDQRGPPGDRGRTVRARGALAGVSENVF